MKQITKFMIVLLCLFSTLIITSGARNIDNKQPVPAKEKLSPAILESCRKAGAVFKGEAICVIKEEDGKEYMIKGNSMDIDSLENGNLLLCVSINVTMTGNSLTLAAKQVRFVLQNGLATELELTEAYVAN